MSGNLGVKIKALRTSLNLTLEEFGQIVGNTTKASVYKWEKNITKPTKKNLQKIAELANKSLDDFLSDESQELSIFEANYLYGDIKHLEKRVSNIINTLEAFEDLSLEELELPCELVDDSGRTTYKDYQEILINELEELNNHYVSELKKLVDFQNEILNSQKTQALLKNDSYSLEMILNSNYSIMINGKLLTAEDKKRALELLKLFFK